MVPVSLSLSNFLSYGEETKTLDFSQFHVACLSGKNGQGKSALLDAITWVLWGEGRKSSGGHKPDEELIRIGTRRMQVEFLFDAEGSRYRVFRAYTRSASGKTSKVELEFQLIGADETEGRPLTGASIRETQKHLNRVLGLDYHTFINSAFLLQGRSDEFTKKKPGERKEILGRILNLSKYDRLSLMARDRQRKYQAEIEVCERDLERLGVSVALEAELETSLAEVVEQLDARRGELEQAQVGVAECTERLGALEAQAREAASLRTHIDQLTSMRAELRTEIRGLTERIPKAQALITDKSRIEADYDRFEKLIIERDDLDTRRDLHRGLERRLEQRKQELGSRRQEFEQKVQKLEMQRQLARENLTGILESAETKGEIEKKLARAQEAEKQAAVYRESNLRRQELLQKRQNLQLEMARERERLQTELDGILARASDLEKQLAQIDPLKKQKRALESRRALHLEQVERTTALIDQGTALGESIKQKEGEYEALQKTLTKLLATLERLNDEGESTCPTCGTLLTAAHRAEVREQYEAERVELDLRLASFRKEIEAQRGERDALRDAYRELKKEVALGDAIAPELARVGEQIAGFDRMVVEQRALTSSAGHLKDQLEKEGYSQDLKAQFENVSNALGEVEFDEKTVEENAFLAAQRERFEERMRQFLLNEGKKQQLETQIEGLSKQIEAQRAELDKGTPFRAIQEHIKELKEQLAQVGFDHERYEQVRVQIKSLAGTNERMRDLVHAEKNLDEWKGRLQLLKEREEESVQTLADYRGKIEGLEQQLQVRDEWANRLAKATQRREDIASVLQEIQVRQGEVQARLAQARADGATLKETRKQWKQAKEQEQLYSKLRKAFGRNGIPSLIIEQTLPEIEERSNELLDRLADGKMRVRLETLKDKKTGGTRETLEITITDEQGVPRPYETFSGGEAFRVNFAVRIALSQMLAERNGVRIRTLGIDEGFGTQDEEGIQNMIEAIQVIQDDFDKILVITHLDQLKEAFPVRIEVRKDPVSGSDFTLIGA